MLLNLVVKNLINLQRLMAAHKFRVNKTSNSERGSLSWWGRGRASVQPCCHSFSPPALITNLSQVALTVVCHNAQRHLWPQSRSKEGARKVVGVKGSAKRDCGGRKKAHSHTVSCQLALTATATVRTVVQLQGKA